MNLIAELRAALGPGAVFGGVDVPDRARPDASDSARHLLLAPLRPSSTDEVSRALAICYRYKQSIAP